ncbi:MAG: Maf family protein [Bacteroidales bacterium]|nr:Maf family protein [Bacteroidales bacterium]OQB71211.1 MAG: Septum formation protein Maf [Bacteroidetes bacterium ADurb.Bin139]MDD3521446.1 Maf family protein [Bacteroidales bacterium]MDD4031384.1 Maf family protein [Bacteroidales bacterium]MDD4435669.1 Maf family protein [Bacteroidales bacterium]
MNTTCRIILGSASSRRQQLLEGTNLPFTVEPVNVPETITLHLGANPEGSPYLQGANPREIPLLLARTKSLAFPRPLKADELLITADTLVFSEVLAEAHTGAEAQSGTGVQTGREAQSVTGVQTAVSGTDTRWRVLGKPASAREAYRMLEQLSGSCHKVITGICLRFGDQRAHPDPIVFSDTSLVWFMPLLPEEIWYYVNKYKPYDKAGSYGVQEWIGYIGIERIEGSYFNVMGFPVHLLWKYLKELHVISFS